MTPPPTYTCLVIGNGRTGKTTYIHRIMDEPHIPISIGANGYNYIQPLDSYTMYNVSEDTRVIELNDSAITLTPDQYVPFITKILVFASVDDEHSIYDVQFHINNHLYLNIPIEIVINKKDLIFRESSSTLHALNSLETINPTCPIHFISSKYGGNLPNLFV
jgi:signal recognition particle receptor subunit beta